MRRLALALASAAALALAAVPAVAQPVGQPPHPKADLTGFNGDPDALPSALQAIEASTGGQVVEIRYGNVGGTPGFDAAVVKGGQISFMRIATPTEGPVAIAASSLPVWSMNWQGRNLVRVARRAKAPLSAAIRTAEQVSGAPAVAAGVATSANNPDNDIHAYNVLVSAPDGPRRIAIDSATGAHILNPGALEGWP